MSHLFGRSPNGYHKARRSPLPFAHKSNTSSSSVGGSSSFAVAEKLDLDPSSSTTAIYVPLPGRRHPLRISLPIPRALWRKLPRVSSRRGAAGGWTGALAAVVCLLWLLGAFGGGGKNSKKKRTGGGGGGFQNPFKDPDTVVFSEEEIRGVWEWEVMSGHWPSKNKVPQSNLPPGYINPAIPSSLLPPPPTNKPVSTDGEGSDKQPPFYFTGAGPERTYANLSVIDPDAFAWPRRPAPGSAADLDVLLDHCDFSRGLFVRDCLEVLRVGGGLDAGRRVRRGDLTPWSYVYTEDPARRPLADAELDQRAQLVLGIRPGDEAATYRDRAEHLTAPKLTLPAPFSPRPTLPTHQQPCDPLRPRLFHIFWAGPFTDKPYMAIMSFLYTQNLGLDLTPAQRKAREESGDIPVCRPKFLVWINPGHAASVPNPTARREMYEALATNPWSAPFLHSRFRDVVQFKLWNTTEQLDGVPELREHWRKLPILNSGGHTYQPPAKAEGGGGETNDTHEEDDIDAAMDEDELQLTDEELAGEVVAGKDRPLKKKKPAKVSIGSSEKDYDKLSTVLSDMVRFVLLHRFGGIYLDADTLFLRDWEELWNWRGAFAYRWSYHDKYNTAIIKLHKGSALTSFLFKTALENKMDFHPMTISRYLQDAGLDPLLYRLPDALFDSAWLNMEGYQRERPPFPYFTEFKRFFVGEKQQTAAPQPAGFSSFFRGAFCYHYHNNWWLPFDPARNWPDLGRRFFRGEKLLREAIAVEKAGSAALKAAEEGEETGEGGEGGPRETSKATSKANNKPKFTSGSPFEEESVESDERDLAWAAVTKRTFEAYVRGEAPNMYGEWLRWE